MKKKLPMGVCKADYHAGRLTDPQLRYRLRRRTDEVERAIRCYSRESHYKIVDIGTADALMLELLKQRFGKSLLVGIEYNLDLLKITKLQDINKLQADALFLPLQEAAFNIVIATAVIEHVVEPQRLIREAHRILNQDGLFILTTPNPVLDMISTKIGLLKDVGHQESFNLKQLNDLFLKNGFDVLEASRFMFSPVGFPGEKKIEKIFGPVGLSLFMANQLVAARKK